MQNVSIKDSATVELTTKILEVVEEAGLNHTDSKAAIKAARALLPALNLAAKPDNCVHTHSITMRGRGVAECLDQAARLQS